MSVPYSLFLLAIFSTCCSRRFLGGKSVLLVTHQVGKVAHAADQVVSIDCGRITDTMFAAAITSKDSNSGGSKSTEQRSDISSEATDFEEEEDILDGSSTWATFREYIGAAGDWNLWALYAFLWFVVSSIQIKAYLLLGRW